jgi:hypothetical protein
VGKGKRNKQKRNTGFMKQFSERLTVNFQEQVRNSEIWDQMVAEFGEQRAEELLRDMKGEIRPGRAPNESGGNTEDIP